MAYGTILFIPGFSGSELYTPPILFTVHRIRVWLNYGVIAAGMKVFIRANVPEYPRRLGCHINHRSDLATTQLIQG